MIYFFTLGNSPNQSLINCLSIEGGYRLIDHKLKETDKISYPSINFTEIPINDVSDLDDLNYNYILECSIRATGNNSNYVKKTREHINHVVRNLINRIRPNDLIIAHNSGVATSRAFHEIARITGCGFWFSETPLIFGGYTQASYKPFTFSCYGLPELNEMYRRVKVCDTKIAKEYLEFFKRKTTKFPQNPSSIIDKEDPEYQDKILVDIEDNYDIFVGGQVPSDTAVVLTNREYINSDEMCIKIAEAHPDLKILYKPHPVYYGIGGKIDRRIYDLENVTVTAASIYNIFQHVGETHVISSSIGIESQLHGVPTVWHSDTSFREFELMDEFNKLRFLSVCKHYHFDRNKIFEFTTRAKQWNWRIDKMRIAEGF